MAEINTTYIDNLTLQIQGINSYIDKTATSFEGLSQDEINKKSAELESYLGTKLNSIRNSVVYFLSSQYSAILKEQELLKPLVEANPANLLDVLGWIKNAITYISGPYGKFAVMQAEILSSATTLSSELQKACSHVFENPNIPELNVEVEPISIEDIIS
ncbi:hypothetical protein DBY21_02885 [Candidatus Gastranaerophilales bacterium]|nr:MAG: hypothetical protein DBY21_02885 [Candidatus Gastranaerophilales bacterium]